MDMNEQQSLMNVMNHIVNILPSNIIMNNIQPDILDMSFQNQQEIIKPTDKEFIKSLEVTEIIEASDEVCCICLEKFKCGDKVVTLPCKDHKHTFHCSSTSNCSGILPWLAVQNTCPICRSEFPTSSSETSTNASHTDNIETIEVSGYIIHENASETTENASETAENASETDENASIQERQRDDMLRALLDLLHHVQPVREPLDEEGFFENDMNEAIRRSLE
jgi:hypothetical protein